MKKKRKATPAKEPTLIEIQRRGLDALSRELGADGLIRFFHLYGLGAGNYTRERHEWLGKFSVDAIAAKIGIKKKRQ